MNDYTSTFDVASLMNTQMEGGLDSRYIPHPIGEWTGMIGVDEKDVEIKSTKAGGVMLNVYITTDREDVTGVTNRNPTRVRWNCMLDMNATKTGLDMSPGKNRRLGMLLTALGLQDADGSNSRPWSLSGLGGRPIRYAVAHKPRQVKVGDNYVDDPEGGIEDEVSSIARV